jgi:hypothetical protein
MQGRVDALCGSPDDKTHTELSLSVEICFAVRPGQIPLGTAFPLFPVPVI